MEPGTRVNLIAREGTEERRKEGMQMECAKTDKVSGRVLRASTALHHLHIP